MILPLLATLLVGAPSPSLSSLVFFSSGKHLLAAAADGTITIWSLSGKNPKRVKTLRAHAGEALFACLYRNDTRFVSLGTDGAVRFWKTSTGRPAGKPLRYERDESKQHFKSRLGAVSPDQTALAFPSADGSVLHRVHLKRQKKHLDLSFAKPGLKIVHAIYTTDGKGSSWRWRSAAGSEAR